MPAIIIEVPDGREAMLPAEIRVRLKGKNAAEQDLLGFARPMGGCLKRRQMTQHRAAHHFSQQF